ncbi:MAG: response regulator [Planctomycetes bacterium]|nr:response regulator [Planctomycetota bacterium]
MRILIADDDPDHRTLLRRIIKRLGDHEIIEAESGSDTFLKANLDEPDLILLDWMMPFQDGVSILRDLRENGVETPVIMVTAKADAQSQQIAIEAGAADVVTKPFTINQMRDLLLQYITDDSTNNS